MNLLEKLNEIDWTRNIILFMLYVSVVALSALFYLLPAVQNHKTQMLDFKKTESLDAQIQNSASNLDSSFHDLLAQNKTTYDNLRNPIDEDALQEYISTYLSDATLRQTSAIEENDILQTTFEISGYAANVKDIMNLIENFSSFNNSLKITFPINISKDESARLSVNLSVIFYTSKHVF